MVVAQAPTRATAMAASSQRGTRQSPGSVWLGSQLKSGDGFQGLLPSAARGSPEPGQRLFWPSAATCLSTPSRNPGGIGVSVPLTLANALAIAAARAAPPLAS